MTKVKEKALYITPHFPNKNLIGAKKRSYFLLQLLLKKYAVLLLTIQEPDIKDGDYQQIKNSVMDIIFFPTDYHYSGLLGWRYSQNRFKSCINDFFCQIPWTAYPGYSNEVRAVFREIDLSQFEIIMIGRICFSGVIFDKQIVNRQRVFIDFDDLDGVALKRQYKYKQFGKEYGKLWSLFAIFDLWKYRDFYKKCLNRAEKVFVCSDIDKNNLRTIVRSKDELINVLPNVVFDDFFLDIPSNHSTDTITYIGAMGYEPNKDAVKYFCGEIFPIILKTMPQVQFEVAGKNSDIDQALLSLASKNIRILGAVECAKTFLSTGTILVVPLRTGGGTRIKILEAMARQLPVVSTEIGCEGLGVKHEENILIANEAREFAEQCLRLLRDEVLRTKLALNAFNFVSNFYKESVVSERVISFFD